MRIDLHYTPQPAGADRRAAAQNNPAAAAKLQPGEDHARLTGAHTQVAALAAQASQLPDLRHERVQALRAAVHGGSYCVDAQEVAAAMIAETVSGPAA